MAKYTHSFSASGDPCGRLKREGWRVEQAGPVINATRGSRTALRLFGAWLTVTDALPMALVATPSGDDYRFEVEDRLGWLLAGPRTTQRYSRAFAELERQLNEPLA